MTHPLRVLAVALLGALLVVAGTAVGILRFTRPPARGAS